MLGNGTWLNVGGNQAVTYGGLTAKTETGGGPYDDPDGGKRYVVVCSFERQELMVYPSKFTVRLS